MKIEEMIRAFPDDKIGIQPLGPAIENVAQKKGTTTITFATDATTPTEVWENTARLGISSDLEYLRIAENQDAACGKSFRCNHRQER